jgi:hypothetical protein
MRHGEIKARLEAVEDLADSRAVRFMVVDHPPTEAQLEHRARLEAEGFRVMFVGNPYPGTPQETCP